MYHSTKRVMLLLAGLVSLGLGLAGIFLPLLPTTPFILLAAYCFSRSSEKLHRWLLNNPHLGPIIGDWEKNGVIRPRIKIISTLTILVIISYPLFFMGFPIILKGVVALTMIAVLIFIWTRPSYPEKKFNQPLKPSTGNAADSIGHGDQGKAKGENDSQGANRFWI